MRLKVSYSHSPTAKIYPRWPFNHLGGSSARRWSNMLYKTVDGTKNRRTPGFREAVLSPARTPAPAATNGPTPTSTHAARRIRQIHHFRRSSRNTNCCTFLKRPRRQRDPGDVPRFPAPISPGHHEFQIFFSALSTTYKHSSMSYSKFVPYYVGRDRLLRNSFELPSLRDWK